VPSFGEPKPFVKQGAAFYGIKQAKNPLDDSAGHPERLFSSAKNVKDQGVPLSEIIGNRKSLKKK